MDPASGRVTHLLVNAGGTAIQNATSTATARQIRAYTMNLPAGTYYVRVQGGTGDTNNYSMTINVTSP